MTASHGMRATVIAVLLLTAPRCRGASVASSGTVADVVWRRGAFRINTLISSGNDSIDVAARKASDASLDFVVFSDQYLVRCEYGFPPFRNVFKLVKRQDSALEFGIERYLDKIRGVRGRYSGLTVIAGVDVAPFYYWTGSWWGGDLRLNQYSEQLTIFGPDDAGFYSSVPVIHNEPWDFHPLRVALRLSPLVLVILGFLVLASAKRPVYADQQGNTYRRRARGKLFVAMALVALGAVWTWNNRPLTADPGYDQYADAGVEPFQRVIDHARAGRGARAGIIWSAPEATMRMTLFGVGLLTAPYLDDIAGTSGHNGLAGIYGDVSVAEKPGKLWDRMLLEHCEGKRRVRPVVIGESDFHGRKPIDMIQTVVWIDEDERNERRAVIDALVDGRSYAVSRRGGRIIELTTAALTSGTAVARLGETLEVDRDAGIELTVAGELRGARPAAPASCRLTLVVDGRIVFSEFLDAVDFSAAIDVGKEAKELGTHYARFIIEGRKTGRLCSNPIFWRRRRWIANDGGGEFTPRI